MRLRRIEPCRECPWRRESAPGWLGGHPAKEFVSAVFADEPVACHLTVKEDGAPSNTEAYCAGALIFARNICKKSRDRGRPELPRNFVDVFSTPKEFLEHHNDTTPLKKEKQHG